MAASDDLKAQVESLQETVSAQQDRIDQLEPDTDGVSRRGVLAGLAGVAGFGAAIPYMSQPAAAQAVGQIGSPTERVDVYGATGDFDALEAGAVNNERVVGGDDEQFSSIQSAHDDLPSFGGDIRLSKSVDGSDESFPIELTKPTQITGDGQVTVENPDANTDVFVVKNDIFDPPSTTISNINIKGGQNGVVIDSTPYTILNGLYIYDCDNNGVRFENTNFDPHSCGIYGSLIDNCGFSGIKDAGKNANSLTLVGTILRSNGNYGCDFRSASQRIIGGSLEKNGAYGLRAKDSSATVVNSVYIEANNDGGGFPASLAFTDTDGGRVMSCYNQGLDQVDHTILLKNAQGFATYGNTVSRVNNGMLSIDGDCFDVEVAKESHKTVNNIPVVASDQGNRTTSHGIIGGHSPKDLSTSTGAYVGQRGLDDGTNVSTTGPMMAVWTGSSWQPSDGASTF